MPVRGVLFDVDDTLFDYSGAEEHGVLAYLDQLGLLTLFPSPAEALALWRQIMEEEYARFLTGELDFVGQHRNRTRRFLARIGRLPAGGMTDAEASDWFAGYGVHRDSRWTAFPDARPVLDSLARTHRLGVVSNSSRNHQLQKLEAIGLLDYFGDAVVCLDGHGEAKPAAGIFRAGCAAIGLEPHEVAYVGDKFTIDAVGARDAGLYSVWLDRSGTAGAVGAVGAVGAAGAVDLGGTEPGIHVIHSLDQLPGALGGWGPSCPSS